MKYLRTAGIVLLTTIVLLLIQYAVRPMENALKVDVNGNTQIVRWPHAHLYVNGDVIHIPTETGTFIAATVVESVVVDSQPIDDEIVYTSPF
ncbi:MAG TPA: hypothetical protein VGB67_01565 [Fibrella sp.]|jgi:hypothetical protein